MQQIKNILVALEAKIELHIGSKGKDYHQKGLVREVKKTTPTIASQKVLELL